MACAENARRASGFTLAEVAIATGILTAVSIGIAPLFLLAASNNLAARHVLAARALAAGKMEQLRSLTFSYDAFGLPITDTSTNLARCRPDATGTGLSASPPATLDRNVAGFVDFADAQGACVGTGTAPPPGAVYTRRWAIAPLPSDPDGALVLSVLVTTPAKAQGRAMLVTVRGRRAP